MDRVYFDYNATTPLAPEVASAMRPFLDEAFGNPSSLHWAGERARTAIEHARRQVARFSFASQLKSFSRRAAPRPTIRHSPACTLHIEQETPPHFIISSVEHPSVAKTASFLERLGRAGHASSRRSVRPGRSGGRASCDPPQHGARVGDARQQRSGNDSTHRRDCRDRARARRAHAFGRRTNRRENPRQRARLGSRPVDDRRTQDVCAAGRWRFVHSQGVTLEPLLHGAGHEDGRRAGTENVLEIVALGAAVNWRIAEWTYPQCADLRDHFWQLLCERVRRPGHPERPSATPIAEYAQCQFPRPSRS